MTSCILSSGLRKIEFLNFEDCDTIQNRKKKKGRGRTVTVSAAKRKANDKYLAKCDRFTLRPLKEDGQRIREAAATAGQSVQKYILQAVEERMARESQLVHDSHQSEESNNEADSSNI